LTAEDIEESMPTNGTTSETEPEQQASGIPSAYTLLVLGLGLPGTALLVFLVSRADGGGLSGTIFGAWVIWVPIAILSGTRSLWDNNFAAGGTRRQRIRAFLAEWFGWTGLLVIAALLVSWGVLSSHGIYPRTGFWLIPEIGVPIVMLAFRGVIRKVGAALLVTLPTPLWIYLLLGGVVLLGPPFIVYLVTIAITRSAASRTQR